jgi:hypothetical protein
MSDRVPRHGEIVTVEFRAPSPRRRRWCGICKIWTWETGFLGSGIWRHRNRTNECRRQSGRG